MFGSRFRRLLFSRDETTDLIRRIVTDHGPHYWRSYAIAFVLMGVTALCTAVPAYLVGDVINQAYIHRDLNKIIAISLAIIAICVVKGASTYGHTVMLARIGNGVMAMNQSRLFAKLLEQRLSFFADRHSSEFTARLVTGVVATNQVLSLLVLAIGRDLLALIGLVAVMVYQDPMLTFVSLVAFPPAMLVLRKMVKRIREVARYQFSGNTRIMRTLQETLQGIRIIKAFNLEDFARLRFQANVADVERESNKMARVGGRSSPLMESLGGIAIALAILYGGYRVIQTGATPGEFFSFLAAFLLAVEPAKRLARLNIDLNSNLVGARVLYEILDSPPSEAIEEGKPQLKLTDARIEFANVRFAYRPEEPVLRGMSFVAEPGRITALVGPSGGGKSTVFNLLLRFYEMDSGSVRIDRQDIAEVSRASLRRQIAYVGQDVFLFHGSIRENIAIGGTHASEDEIIAAAKAAHAHEFISRFPAGYDTPVGERGAQLSGGERQRVAIARALIKNAPIILLDEATASLDSESERLVQDAMAQLCHGRTTIVIAHRLHTITHADRILVVEAGAVVESGRHEELLRKSGRYAAFYRLQVREQQSPPPVAVATA
jgi:ATP-binding cassette, subfamily B, bacterial MsbA